jgi:hypothetical protein
VPEFHLRQWVGKDGRLERYTNPHNRIISVRRVSPSETGWEAELYSIPDQDSRRRQALELTFFQRVDGAAARVLPKLMLPDPSLSRAEKEWWAIYAVTLLHRTPDALASFKRAATGVLSEVMNELQNEYEMVRSPRDPLTYDEYRSSISFEDEERRIMDVFPRVIIQGRSAQHLLGMRWRVIDVSTAKHRLMISDYPVIRTNGFRVPNGHLAIPLSPVKLFVAAPAISTFRTIAGMMADEIVRNTNREIVGCARRFVAASDRCQERFVQNRFGKMSALRLFGEL